MERVGRRKTKPGAQLDTDGHFASPIQPVYWQMVATSGGARAQKRKSRVLVRRRCRGKRSRVFESKVPRAAFFHPRLGSHWCHPIK